MLDAGQMRPVDFAMMNLMNFVCRLSSPGRCRGWFLSSSSFHTSHKSSRKNSTPECTSKDMS